MPPTLSVEVTDEEIERSRADLSVVFFFDSDRPLRGDAGRADWRLCGRISHLLRAGKLSGAPGDALLTPTGGGLRAPWLLGLGLGPRAGFDADACRALARDAVSRARRLGAGSLALSLPDSHAGGIELSARVEALLAGAVAALAEDSADVRLNLVAPASEASRTRKAVAAAVSRLGSAAVAVQAVGLPAPGRPAPSPHGALGSSPQSRQGIK